jgi:hypothetical protein
MDISYILVQRERYEGDTIYGVYSTKGKALKALNSERDRIGLMASRYLILEVDVNQEPDWNSADVLDTD